MGRGDNIVASTALAHGRTRWSRATRATSSGFLTSRFSIRWLERAPHQCVVLLRLQRATRPRRSGA
ncbi:MAG: hypothetical protein AVDCRST_MAG68-3988 [uncultured Gemmatimonadetes bacterium]|uniref:Uncharacterized protein n=1 Tax=uncultured Gemmatimonadota bacterium TaxID=203437 RepID=A0A6J4M0P7_9BACT|nr:MAG: hypothetical protein AVDCRST_MAG68-3988 [uncultured Gemmatimonadota bacterium]